eukprot:1157570-Pelagomonas_calceolata.AAC.16
MHGTAVQTAIIGACTWGHWESLTLLTCASLITGVIGSPRQKVHKQLSAAPHASVSALSFSRPSFKKP